MQILNTPAAAQAEAASAATATPATSSSAGTASATGTTVTANDFLTLLVAEMKNQDPTSNTDPNAYINQLVQVNSLQQLISINQEVGAMGTTAGSTGSGTGAVRANGAMTPATGGASEGKSSAQAVPAGTQPVAQAGKATSTPAQAIDRFAAMLRGEPTAPSSAAAKMSASAARVASALGPVKQEGLSR